MSVKIGSFARDGKEFPTIELKNGNESKFGFTFGVSKARLILDHVDEIRKFVEDSENTEG
jgi:hypothetical protein